MEWVSAIEINNDYYTIERSKDGKGFEFVGTVEASDITSSNSYYELVDYNLYVGKSYYQLTQTDYDGASETFPIVSVKVNDYFEHTVDLYPNPRGVDGHTNLNIRGFEAGREILVILRDLLGNEHYSKVVIVDNNGHADIAIDLSEILPVGADTEHRTSNIEHRMEHRMEHRTPNIEHRTSNGTPNTEHRTSNIEWNTEHRTSNGTPNIEVNVE